jgi:hypothetical protein
LEHKGYLYVKINEWHEKREDPGKPAAALPGSRHIKQSDRSHATKDCVRNPVTENDAKDSTAKASREEKGKAGAKSGSKEGATTRAISRRSENPAKGAVRAKDPKEDRPASEAKKETTPGSRVSVTANALIQNGQAIVKAIGESVIFRGNPESVMMTAAPQGDRAGATTTGAHLKNQMSGAKAGVASRAAKGPIAGSRVNGKRPEAKDIQNALAVGHEKTTTVLQPIVRSLSGAVKEDLTGTAGRPEAEKAAAERTGHFPGKVRTRASAGRRVRHSGTTTISHAALVKTNCMKEGAFQGRSLQRKNRVKKRRARNASRRQATGL